MTTATQRVDDLDRYYKPVDQLERVTTLLFWLSTTLSVAVFYGDLLPWPTLENLPSLLFVPAVLLHFALSQYIRFHLLPRAESKRRQVLLSNAFDVPLSSERTNRYYNNPLEPSIKRLAANIFENAFFAKHVCEEMAQRERRNLFIYALIYMVALLMRTTDLGLLIVLTQTLFSGELLIKWFHLEILRQSNERVYDDLYGKFLSGIDMESGKGIASVLHAFSDYETAKARASIKQSSKIFFKLNPELTEEWETIKQKLSLEV